MTSATLRSIDTPSNRAKVRRHLGIYNQQVPILFADSDQAPRVHEGEQGGWFTRGGTPINHPGAYSRIGWSNMVYHTDTRVVIVGVEWDGLDWA